MINSPNNNEKLRITVMKKTTWEPYWLFCSEVTAAGKVKRAMIYLVFSTKCMIVE